MHHGIGSSAESLAQLRILSGDSDRAGVLVADTHHQATERDEWSGGEAELFCAQEAGYRDVATGFKLTVGFDADA
jgi:hypothetical protein